MTGQNAHGEPAVGAGVMSIVPECGVVQTIPSRDRRKHLE